MKKNDRKIDPGGVLPENIQEVLQEEKPSSGAQGDGEEADVL